MPPLRPRLAGGAGGADRHGWAMAAPRPLSAIDSASADGPVVLLLCEPHLDLQVRDHGPDQRS